MNAPRSPVAFLGLGAMGRRMAVRLLDAGFPLRVFNRSAGPAAELGLGGAIVCRSPREAARGAAFVLSMVTDDEASAAVWLHPESGARGGLAEGTVAVEHSTLTPGFVAELASALGQVSVPLVDAPLAGSRPQAESGQLVFLVGGEAGPVARVAPVLEPMGAAIHHVGGPGAGAHLKLAVNALFALQVAGVAEVLGSLAAAGLDVGRAWAQLAATPVVSPAARGAGEAMQAGRYAPLFPIDLVEKDLRYAEQTATAAGTSLPLAAAARRVFERARAQGLGGDHIVGVRKLYPLPPAT